MKRREFLRNSGWFVLGASLTGMAGCESSPTLPNVVPPGREPEPAGTFKFTHGVASGDPRAQSVVLWTRAVRVDGTDGDVLMRVDVATDSSFGNIVATGMVDATAASDHTVRVRVGSLFPGTTYYYRFAADADTSIIGQTRTAPDVGDDVQVNFAWVSCQDYGAGFYGAYRQMLVDDEARADEDKIHAVIHLGDFIYETRADDFQGAIGLDFQPIKLTNPDSTPRSIPAFPDGGTINTAGLGAHDVNFAKSVDDYRQLYRTFLSDPDLQAARARWPFICVWDDHEFSDDCWQTQANYTDTHSLDEASQTRRVAASQAWIEYTPAQLSGSPDDGDVPQDAADFTPPDPAVEDSNYPATVVSEDNFTNETNNVDAIKAITIYRSLRFGQHVELVMTDLRSYRSDHAIPEEFTAIPQLGLFAPRNALPLGLVKLLDLGSGFPGGAPATIPNTQIANPRQHIPTGTMLGAAQKKWWKAIMKGSDATWKLWGNEVSLMRMRLSAVASQDPPLTLPDLVVSGDAWDGYHAERTELMTYLKDNAIGNVVVLSGDIHASFAGMVLDDFDAAKPTVVANEFIGAGISSNSLLSFFLAATSAVGNVNPQLALLPHLIVTNASPGGSPVTENLNLLLLEGTQAAVDFASTLGAPTLHSPPQGNAHLRYVDTNAQGYGYIKVTADKVDASIVTINRPITTPSGTEPPGIKRTADFSVASGKPAEMIGPTITGTKPFPLT